MFFISVPKTIECVLCAVVFSLLFSGCFYRLLGILQSSGYSGTRLIKWSHKKGNLVFGRHVLLTLLCALSCAVISLSFSFAGEWSAVIGFASYIIFFSVFIWADNRVALRTPLTFTPRLKRLFVVLVLVNAIISYLAICLLNFGDSVWGNHVFTTLRYCPLSVFPLLMFPIALIANLIDKIYEVPHNKTFVKKAKAKLANSDIKVIGITGSYGKTSCKIILTDILSKKYRVLSTPRSHNTPMGLALSINNNDLKDYDIFIAEMGARHVGDIAELCEFCPPDIAVITGICPQHLESFGSIENVIKAKSEILAGGAKYFISPDCSSLFEAYSGDNCCLECVSDIVCNAEGSTFTINLGGKAYKAHTRLLGKHSVENVAISAQVAYNLGMTAEEIVAAIDGVDFIEHRLQLIKSGGVNILDDGYNSNVKGAAAALEVLRSFGGRKIVVTPGLVELGVLEEEENTRLGEQLVGLDFVILVGETLITPVKNGYLANGGEASTLKVVPTLNAAQEELKTILQDGDTVLFLNDLPDIY
ncbi:MAG: hypothetical protein K2O28_02045 [Clostridia bacterium]|nr:hypothetical protein [Clostridia bacterium]